MRYLLLIAAAMLFTACSSAPKYDKLSAKYLSCDSKDMKPVEITNHGWYRSWYVDCGGQEYFCRYSASNENGWNGCHLTQND
jgi:hypothetical protein